MKLGLVVSNDLANTNVLIYDVFTLVFHVRISQTLIAQVFFFLHFAFFSSAIFDPVPAAGELHEVSRGVTHQESPDPESCDGRLPPGQSATPSQSLVLDPRHDGSRRDCTVQGVPQEVQIGRPQTGIQRIRTLSHVNVGRRFSASVCPASSPGWIAQRERLRFFFFTILISTI